jgi:hypothetical protein
MNGPQGEPVYWRSERMWQRDPIFQAVAVKPELLENIGQCVGQAIFPWNDSLVVKLAHQGAPVAWHQDPPYGNPARETTFPIPNFTTDIYLDTSGPDNGCVYALPRHHLVGHIELKGKTHDDFLTRHGAKPLVMQPATCCSTRSLRRTVPRRISLTGSAVSSIFTIWPTRCIRMATAS